MSIKTLIRNAFLLTVLCVTGLFSVQAQSAEEILDRMKTRFDTIDTFRAEFSQVITSEFSDEREMSSGVLTMKKDQYRVETPGQTIVTDGITTWVYLPYEDQVLINDYEEDEMTFSINDFFFNYRDQYDITAFNTDLSQGVRYQNLTLVPRSGDAFFLSVTLSMRDSDDVVTFIEVVDANGTTMEFTLTNIVLNPLVEESTFQYTPPAGVEIVDLRS